MVGAWVGDDLVPDDSLVGSVDARLWGGPFGRHVDEDLLSVPCEEGGQIGVKGELDDSVLLLLGAIVVRSALDSVDSGELSANCRP